MAVLIEGHPYQGEGGPCRYARKRSEAKCGKPAANHRVDPKRDAEALASSRRDQIEASSGVVRCCGTCLSFRPAEGIEDGFDHADVETWQFSLPSGECCHNPPAVARIDPTGEEVASYVFKSVWPVVAPSDFCIRGWSRYLRGARAEDPRR